MILYDVEYICLYTWFFDNCFIPLSYTLYIQICKNCNIHNFTCYFAGCGQFTYCAYDREISNRWFGKFVCFIAWEGSPYVEKGMTQSTIGMLLIFSNLVILLIHHLCFTITGLFFSISFCLWGHIILFGWWYFLSTVDQPCCFYSITDAILTASLQVNKVHVFSFRSTVLFRNRTSKSN